MSDDIDRLLLGRRTLRTFFLILLCSSTSLFVVLGSGVAQLRSGPFFLGEVAPVQAALNRETIEAMTGAVTLPNGMIQLDRAVKLKGRVSLSGPATLKNSFAGLDQTMHLEGSGIGYFDPLKVVNDNTVDVGDINVATNYSIGSPAFFFILDGFVKPTGQLCGRRTVTAKAGSYLTLDGPVDKRVTAGKRFANAVIIPDPKQGQSGIQLSSPADAARFAPGDYVLLTEGATVANEGRDEWHRVVSVQDSAVQLETAVQRGYTQAVLAKAQPIVDCSFKDLTIDVPPDPVNQDSGFFKYCYNLRFEKITVKGRFDFGNCAHLTFVNCKFDDVALNSSHNVTFVNCSFASLYLEECCFDVLATGCTFGPGLPPPHPIGSPLFSRVGCERMTFRVSTVYKASLMPVSIQGNDVVFDDLTISESAANQVAYFDGDRKQVLRVRSDCPIALKGKATLAQSIIAPATYLGWTDDTKSQGVAIGCMSTSIKQGDWVIVP
jgi:hypothetical protein